MGTRCHDSHQILYPQEYVTHRETCYGEPHLISSTTHEGDKVIVNEYIIDRLVPVPKLQTKETLVEKTIIIPQVRVIEELVDVPYKVREKIVEVSKPIIKETIIEEPEREIRETIIPHPYLSQPTIHPPRQPAWQAQTARQAQPARNPPYNIVSPFTTTEHYRRPAEYYSQPHAEESNTTKTSVFPPAASNRLFQVEESVEEPLDYIYRPVGGSTLNPKLTPECLQASPPAAEGPNRSFTRTISEQPMEFVVPRIKTVYKTHYVPVPVPRFVETAVAAEQCDEGLLVAAANCDQGMLDTLASLSETESTRAPGTAPTLGELDQCWQRISDLNFNFEILQQTAAQNIMHWWNTNQLLIDSASIASVCAGVDSSGEGFIETVSVVRKRSTPPNLHDASTSSEGDLGEELTTFFSEEEECCFVG